MAVSEEEENEEESLALNILVFLSLDELAKRPLLS